jgi:hypothetical protein
MSHPFAASRLDGALEGGGLQAAPIPYLRGLHCCLVINEMSLTVSSPFRDCACWRYVLLG